MAWCSNGWSIGLCTRPTIRIPDQYIRKQDGVHLPGIQIVGLSGIQMAFENWTIRIPSEFGIQIPTVHDLGVSKLNTWKLH